MDEVDGGDILDCPGDADLRFSIILNYIKFNKNGYLRQEFAW
jgi:hypothetical protein